MKSSQNSKRRQYAVARSDTGLFSILAHVIMQHQEAANNTYYRVVQASRACVCQCDMASVVSYLLSDIVPRRPIEMLDFILTIHLAPSVSPGRAVRRIVLHGPKEYFGPSPSLMEFRKWQREESSFRAAPTFVESRRSPSTILIPDVSLVTWNKRGIKRNVQRGMRKGPN